MRESLFMMLVSAESFLGHERVAPRELVIGGDHLRHQLIEARGRAPSHLLLRLRRIAQERVHFGRAEITRIDLDDRAAAGPVDAVFVDTFPAPLDLHPELGRGSLDELTYGMLLTRRDH